MMNSMLDLVRNLPNQIREAVQTASGHQLPVKDITNLVYAGLGGSAIGGDFIVALTSDQARIPITVVRNYSLPNWVSSSTLAVCVSYSGNTEETLSAYEAAKSRGASILAVTSGGQLAMRAKADGHTVVTVPGGLSPRAAVGYLMIPTLHLLGEAGVFSYNQADTEEAIEIIESRLNEPIDQLAEFINEKIPLIYGAIGISGIAALRWKCQINENAKMLAFCNNYPELNHNEIVGFEQPADLLKHLRVIHLVSAWDDSRNSKRMQITEDILKADIPVMTVTSAGKSKMAQLLSLVVTGDLLSLGLADKMGIDPVPIKKIDILKQRMAD